MRLITTIGLLSAICGSALAQYELYGLVRDSNDDSYLVQIDPTDASNTQVIGAVNATNISWLGYDRHTDSFLTHDTTGQFYRLDRDNGAATALSGSINVTKVQGVDYVAGRGMMAVTGGDSMQRSISDITSNGELSLWKSYPDNGDLDELLWDDARDQIYVSDAQRRLLFTINDETGDLINTLNLPVGQGAVGRGSVHPTNGYIYEVDSAGSASSLGITIYRRDPISGLRVDSIGDVLNAAHVHGLAFTPEPSSLVGLSLVGLLAVRRR